jgi:hypothetical protein
MTAYKEKFNPGIQIGVYGVINGQGVMLWIWLNKDIKTNEDIPDFVKHYFQLPSGNN